MAVNLDQRVCVGASNAANEVGWRVTFMIASLAGLLLLVQTANAAPPVHVVDARVYSQSLAAALLVVADDGRDLDLDSVAAGRHDEEAIAIARSPLNLGYPRHAYWVRFALHNAGDRDLDRLLVLWRGASQSQLLRLDDGVNVRIEHLGRGGDRIGDVRSRHQVLRLHLPAHAKVDVTLRVESRVALVLDYRLMSEAALANSDSVHHWFFGILLGSVLSIGVFVLAIWFAMRERIFLWFSGFALSILIYQLHAEGYAYILLGRDWQVPGSYVSAYFGALHSACLVLLVRDFVVNTAPRERLDRYVVRPLLLLNALVVPLFPISSWLGNTTVALAVVITGAALVAVLCVGLWRGWLRIRGFFVALVLYWIAGDLYLLKRIGVLPDILQLTVAQELTMVVAVFMFALAISTRVRRLALAHRASLQQYSERLEHDVAERTRQYREATERAENALAQLQHAQQQLVQQEKMASLGALVAGVAHEVNTPLGVALTASSHLAAESLGLSTKVQAGALTRSEFDGFVDLSRESSVLIQRNLERAAHLIQSFKRVSVDRTSDGRRSFNLKSFIGELVDSLALTWKQRPVSLVVECPDEVQLDSFPGALGQVLANLIQNSLLHAFAPGQSGEMRIRARLHGPHQVEISFSDNGPGAPPEVIAKIFEPFFTTKRNQGGTGLGLHVAFNLVAQKLGGSMSVSGGEGSGLRFDLILPLVAP